VKITPAMAVITNTVKAREIQIKVLGCIVTSY
jgi:hypothetical protein